MDVNAAGQAFNNMAAAVAGLQQYLQNQHSNSDSSAPNSGSVSIQIPQFSGSDRELASIWLLQAEEAFNAKSVAENKKVSTAVLSLFGGALSWYLAAKDDMLKESRDEQGTSLFIKWSVFVKELKGAFPVHNEQVELRKLLRNLRQTARVSEYTAKFRVLHGLISKMDECDALLNYTEGLKPEIRAEVDYNSPQTLKDAIDIASKFDTAFYGRLNPQRYFSYLSQHSKPFLATTGDIPSFCRETVQSDACNPDNMEIDNLERVLGRGRYGAYRPMGWSWRRGRGRGFRGRGRGLLNGTRGWHGSVRKVQSAEERKRQLQRQLDYLNNACYNCHQPGHSSYDKDCPKSKIGRFQNLECEEQEKE